MESKVGLELRRLHESCGHLKATSSCFNPVNPVLPPTDFASAQPKLRARTNESSCFLLVRSCSIIASSRCVDSRLTPVWRIPRKAGVHQLQNSARTHIEERWPSFVRALLFSWERCPWPWQRSQVLSDSYVQGSQDVMGASCQRPKINCGG